MRSINQFAGRPVHSHFRRTADILRQRLVRGLLALCCAAGLGKGGAQAQPAGRQFLRSVVPAAARQLHALERLAGSNRLDLTIVLPLRNAPALTSLLGQLYDPASPEYHHYLTPAQFTERFGPTPRDYQAVMAFAKAHGFRVTRTHPNRTLLNVNGAVADIEKALHVKMQVYQHPTEARTFYAPAAEPSVDLATAVLGISGLDDYARPQPAEAGGCSLHRVPAATSGAEPLATGAGPRGSFIGKDFRAAYAPGVPLDGAGQAVGLLEFDGYYPSDVAAYENLAGLPHVPLTNVLAGGFGGWPGANNVEVALDIDMAIAMAPGLVKVIVYEASSASGPVTLLNQMATDTNSLGQPAALQLSSSWSWRGLPTTGEDQIFQQFAAQGQSFFQAAGDSGAYCGTCPPPPPSDSPYITTVGGTSLTTSTPGGSWQSESVWSPGGGGVSTNYPIPIWQQGVDMTGNGGSTALRNLPDVACLADAVIWLVANNGEDGVTGGTSASAPLWAGFAALANQQAAANAQPSIGFINPAIYAIGRSSGYGSAFHDITAGNITNTCCGTTKFFAVPGYDLCTGWGTPNGSNLISALLAPPPALRITPPTPLAFSGPPGGPFRPAAQGLVLTNDSNAALSWTVANAAPWLEVSPAGGALTNGGSAARAIVTLTAAASSLPLGSYAATLWFTNVNLTNMNDQFGQCRQVTLDIVAPPVITLQPSNQVVLQGMTASFTVAVANGASCSYQWRYDNGQYVTNLNDGSNIAGSATSTLVISDAAPANVGAYSVIVSNAAGSVVSAEALLGVLPWRPEITAQPASQSVLEGQTATFTVTAVGSPPLFYLWQRNGTSLSDGGNISGATASSLTITSALASDAGTYAVMVGNADGLASSTGVVLTVSPMTAPDTGLTALYSFTGGEDGGNPNGLLRAANGALYGTTQNGGTNDAGSVFQLTAGGLVNGLYSFTGGDDGATPLDALAQGPDGNLYGTAFQGGAYDNGTVFRMTPSGVLSVLVSFNITNGDLPYAGLTLGDDLNLYGTTYQGGSGGRGTAFQLATAGALTTLYSFTNGIEGGHLAAGLLKGNDGSFYGTTYKGGAYGYGTVFQLTASGTRTGLASFNQTNGAFPLAALAQDPAGTLYGTTSSGGASNHGTIFAITPPGAPRDLYSFGGGSDGGFPAGALLPGSDGNFYGTTAYGGAYGDGTVFRLTPDGSVTTLVAFDGYAGANPQAALIEDADGTLLGTTQNGGASGAGVIFRLSFSGPLQITSQPVSQLAYVGDDVVLSVAVTGARPISYQWRQSGTNLVEGGHVSGSTNRLLRLANVTTNDAGSYSVVVNNPGGSTNSIGALLQVVSSAPVIVLAPASQSPAACTTVTLSAAAVGDRPLSYQWQKNGVNLTDGCNLSGSATPTLLVSNVSEADNGTYTVVVSNAVGSTSAAAVLSLVPASAACTSLNTLHWFTGGADGQTANGVAQGTNGILYGTTYSGGGHPWGTVFSLTTNGAFTTLASFSETNGANPTAAPVQGADGKFYGTTRFGGAEGAGAVYSLTADGTLTTIYSFGGEPDGAWPSGTLAQGADRSFYGTTTAGGEADQGTVFRLTTDGVLTNLHLFNGADGVSPAGGLAQGYDGSFYGLASSGGASNDGTVFKISPAGAFTLLYSFTGGSDGSTPVGALVRGSDGNFYGVTKYSSLAKTALFGAVFRITPTGTLTTLHVLGDVVAKDGWYPYAGLVQGLDGNLYGTTYSDPVGGHGTLFRVPPDGSSFATLVYFDGCNDGAHPQAALTEDASGNLYGTTTASGPCQAGRGTLFRLSFGCAPHITAPPASQAVVGGAQARLGVAVCGVQPFSYQWQKNGTNLFDGGNVSGSTNRTLLLANVSLADAATYSVSVSNTLGSAASAAARLTVVYPPAFLSAVRTNCTLTLTWSALPGQRYQLQYKPGLAAANWSHLGNAVTANASTLSASDNLCTNAQKCYRVVLFPQVQ